MFVSLQSPVEPDDVIEWNEFYQLQWSDFRGKSAVQSIGDAGAVVKIKAKPYYVKRKIKYDVYAFFNRSKSWYRDSSDALLIHEQLHFDIAELYARMIRRKIAKLSDAGVNDPDVYNAAIRELLDESNDTDMQYDAETLHGSLTKRQAAWNKQITDELAVLENYRRKRTVISR